MLKKTVENVFWEKGFFIHVLGLCIEVHVILRDSSFSTEVCFGET